MNKKIAIAGWIAWALASSFFLTEYFVRVSVGVLSGHLINEFHVDAAAVGLLSAYFYYAYVAMQIPVGILVDRFGARNLLSVATILFGASCILFSHMDAIYQGYIARFIMGLAGAFAFVGTLKLITEYFPPNKFALLSGLSQGGGMVGAIIGAAPMAYLFSKFGWRLSFASFGTGFIVLGILMYILIRNEGKIIIRDKHKSSTVLSDLKIILSSKQTWLNCLFIGLCYAPTEVFGEEWGTMFFSTSSHTTLVEAAFKSSIIFMGMVIGCPLIGHISDKLKNRVKVMRVCSIACFILISLIVYHYKIGHFSFYIMFSLLFLYGIFNSAIIPSYAIATEIHNRHLAGIAIGITNMATVAIGAVFIPLIGFIMDYLVNNSHTSTHSSLKIISSEYTNHDFSIAFILLPICFIACFIITFFIKETHCIAKS
jgi:MFS family permease